MQYHEYPPPPSLRPYVRCFWALEAPAVPGGALESSAEETVLPDGCTELIVHFGDRYRVREASPAPGGAPAVPRVQSFAVVGGPIQRAIRLEPTGATGIVAARFEPHGAAAFLRDSASRFTDRILDLE